MTALGYFDESGHAAQPGYFGVAGFIGSDYQWSILRPLWVGALANVGAPYLHMREFAHSVGAFEGWKDDRQRREKLMAGLVRAVLESRLVAVGSAMRIGDFKALDGRERAHLGSPYHCCLQDVLFGFELTIRSGPPRVRGRIMSDQTAENRGVAAYVYARYREERFNGFEEDLLFGDARHHVELQAADLLAYEITKELSNQDRRPDDRMRWPLDQIITDQTLRDIQFIKYNTAEILAAQASGEWDALGHAVVTQEMDEMMRIYRGGERLFPLRSEEPESR